MKLKANEYIYSIKNLTYGEVRQIEYAYGQFIHNAVSGDFAETNGRLDDLRARIEKKPIRVTTSEEDFITIPKPKFRVGDVVKTDNGAVFTIDLFENLDLEDGWIYQFYDPNDNKWRYLAFEDYEWSFHEEDWLELVEEGR